MLREPARPRGPLAGEPGAAGRRAQARPQVRGVRSARGRRVTARQAGRGVQVTAAGADGAEVRYGLDRILHPVQEEGLAPEARRRGACRRHHGQAALCAVLFMILMAVSNDNIRSDVLW